MTGSEFDEDIYASLSNPDLPGLYVRQNQKEAVDEDLGLWDYGSAAATGLYHGIALTAPETYTRVLHRFGKLFGSDSMTEWARNKLDEYALLREEDPYWRPDEKWMTSYTAKSLYEGFNSISNSAAMMLPGLAAVAATPFTGGTSLGALFLGAATGAGTISGIAEYDSFLDDAYRQLHPLNPELSREDIEDEHFWSAVMSGFAEGGLEFAGDALGGKLIGLFGKAGAEPARHIISKIFRNSMRSMLSEVPSELATAGIQDWLRENAGLDHQGRIQAMVNALGPAVVSGGAFGAAGTVATEVRNAMHPADAKTMLDTYAQQFSQAELKDRFGEGGYQFLTEKLMTSGMTKEQALAVAEVAKGEATQWAEKNGRDVGEWWTDKSHQFQSLTEGGWSELTALAQAMVTPEASFDSVVGSTTNALITSLDVTQKESLTTKYGATDMDGAVGLDGDKVAADFLAFMKDPQSLELDPQTQEVFGTMRDKLLNSYGTIKEAGAVRISPEAQKMFDAVFPHREQRRVEAPKMYEAVDEAALNRELGEITLNSPEANDKIAAAFTKNTKYNFGPWTLGSDFKAAFAAIDKALAPHLDGLLARQSDKKADAKAIADLEANGYNEAGINSLFEDVVGSQEGSLSFRNRKAQIYQAVVLKNMQQLALEYNAAPSPQNAAALLAAREVYKGIHIQMRGVRAEAGRFLRSYNKAGQDNRLDLRRLNDMVEAGGGSGAIGALAAILTNTQDPQQLKERIEGTWWDKTKGMLIEHVTLGMLTNPATQVVNVAGNGLTLVQETLNRFVGEKFNPGTRNGIAKGETMAMVNGFLKAMQNIREAWGSHTESQGGTWSAIKNIDQMQWQGAGSSLLDDGGMMTRQLTYANAKDVIGGVLPKSNIKGLSTAHAAATHGLSTAVEFYGRSLGIVSKGLLTADMFFKTVAYHMELNARAFRRASQEAQATGGDVQTLYKRYADKALKVDKDSAMDFAKKVTFQSDLGAIGRNINKIRQEAPLTRLIIPFLKTPINIIKYGAAHTPGISSLFKETRGELHSQDAAVRQLAEARVMTGTMLWTAALGLAAQGMLTGNGPPDPEERRRLEATGWQSNSLKIGDTYIGLDRLDPGAFIFNTAASFTEIAQHLEGEDAEKATSAALGAAIRTVTNRSYLQSVQSILDLVMNIDRPEGQRALRDMVTNTLVPASALSRTTARVIDPIAHETDNIFNQLRVTIPGLSLTAPVRRNFLGEAIAAPDAWGPDYLSPFRGSVGKQDPVYDEIARLGLSGQDMPRTPQRVWKVGDKSARLSAEQYGKFLEESGTKHKINGKTLKEYLGGLVSSGLYASATEEQKASLISSAVESYRKATKQKMIR